LLDSAPNQSYVLLNSAQFPANLSAYTVEADFNMATRSSSTGLFGLTFLEQPNDAGYIFQWNGNPENTPPHWQIQKDAGSSGNGFTYLPPAGFGAGVAAPTYTPGNWVHLKVVVVGGTTFNCYVNLYDGNGDQLVYSLTDTLGAPYTSGEVGFREVMVSPNSLQMRNFHVFACGAPNPTATPTPALTATATSTSTITPTASPTPVGLHVWPNPFNPAFAVGGFLRAYQVPPGATMSVYTVSCELVLPPLSPDATGLITWNGTNKNGRTVSSGIYYYVIQASHKTLLAGKILVLGN